MSIVYAIITFLSCLLMIGYGILIKNKKIWIYLLFIFTFIVNIGYLMLSLSTTLEFAIFSNIVAYFGSAYLPIFLIIIVLDVCDIKRNKILPIIFLSLATIIFVMVLSQAWSNQYYSSVSLNRENGYSKLVKEYGPLHLVYMIYLIGSFISIISIIVYSMNTKIKRLSKNALFIASIVFGNIGVWAIEQFIKTDFEFLSVSYLFSEFAILFVYWMAEDYLETKIIIKYKKEENDLTIYNDYLENISISKELTNREMDVLKSILRNKTRKEIALELNVSENTIKTHTRHVFEKINVQNRKELFEQANNYNKL